jgi:hypothetical protein
MCAEPVVEHLRSTGTRRVDELKLTVLCVTDVVIDIEDRRRCEGIDVIGIERAKKRELLAVADAANPFIVKKTTEDPRTARVFGGLCFTKEGGDTTTTNSTKVWLSLFNVRKVQDDKGNITTVQGDINTSKSENGTTGSSLL